MRLTGRPDENMGSAQAARQLGKASPARAAALALGGVALAAALLLGGRALADFLGEVQPTPAPTKTANRSYAQAGDGVAFTITRQVHEAGETAPDDYAYDGLGFEDALPAGLTYRADSLVVTDAGGDDVTGEGTTDVQGSVLTWAASAAYLSGDGFDMNGGQMTFSFVADVDDGATSGTQFANEALVWLDDDGPDRSASSTDRSNQVTVAVYESGLDITCQTVGGSPAEQAETFNVTVSLQDDDGQPVSGTFGGTTFQNGTATVGIQGGSAFVIPDIPAGTRYTLSQADTDCYLAGFSNRVGFLPDEGRAEATVTETRKIGVLRLSKLVEGAPSSEANRAFDFTIELSDTEGQPVTGTYPIIEGSAEAGSESVTGDGDIAFVGGTARVSLKNMGGLAIGDVPAGFTYTITESESSSHTTQYTPGQSGTVA